MDSQNIKQKLFTCCKTIIETRIANSRSAMNDAQNSANTEEKSSAGDKYETSRAMGHLNRDLNAKQMAEALDTLNILNGLDVSTIHTKVQAGSVVVTTNGNYFIAVSAGTIKINEQHFFAISPITPIGQVLLNSKVGDIVDFNGKKITITEIF